MYPRLARPATDHAVWKTRYALAARPSVAQLTECPTDPSSGRIPAGADGDLRSCAAKESSSRPV
jgi:hypothetical protein